MRLKKLGMMIDSFFLMDFSLGAPPAALSHVLSKRLRIFSLDPLVTASEAVSHFESSLGLFDLIKKALRT